MVVVATVGAILRDGDRVLLGRRAAHKSFAGCWDVIGGHVEPGETPWAALSRELVEEIGVHAVAGHPAGDVSVTGRDGGESLLRLYEVSGWRGEPAIRNDEHVALCWFPRDEAMRLPGLVTAAYRRFF